MSGYDDGFSVAPLEQVRVVVFEQRPLVAAGLAAVLCGDDDFDVVGTAADFDEVVRMVDDADAQVLVFGLERGSVERCRDLAARLAAAVPGRRLGLVGVVSSGADLVDVFGDELLAVITTAASPEELCEAVLGALPGGLAAGSLRLMLPRPPTPSPIPAQRSASLTKREREVLRGIETGQSTKEMAAELGIAVNTVRTHAQRLMSKLNVHSRLQAAAQGADAAPAGPDVREDQW